MSWRRFKSCCPDQFTPAGGTSEREGDVSEDLQTGPQRDAIGQRQHQAVGARLRAGDAARDRAPDGLDRVERHEAGVAFAFRQQGRGGRLLRAPRHSLSGVRAA